MSLWKKYTVLPSINRVTRKRGVAENCGETEKKLREELKLQEIDAEPVTCQVCQSQLMAPTYPYKWYSHPSDKVVRCS